MRKLKFIAPLGLVLLWGVSIGGCPLTMPQLKDKVVELAAGGSTFVSLHGSGTLGTHDDTKTVDIKNGLDLSKTLDDAGIDASNVEEVKFAGAAYRVTKADPTAGRTITNGTVTVERGNGVTFGPVTNIITNFNAAVGATTGWITATTIDPAGSALINTLLADLLNEVKNGVPATNTVLRCHVTGNCPPSGSPAADFDYDVKVIVTIKGTVKVKTIG